MPEPGGPGGPLAPPIFGSSVNPIPPGEGRLPHLLLLAPPMFFTFRHHWGVIPFPETFAVSHYILIQLSTWADYYHKNFQVEFKLDDGGRLDGLPTSFKIIIGQNIDTKIFGCLQIII